MGKMGNIITDSGKGIKLIITFIIAIALYICIAPTEASASVAWSSTMTWNDAKTYSTSTGHIMQDTIITVDSTSTGTIYIDSGKITVNGADVETANKLELYIAGGTVEWNADIESTAYDTAVYIQKNGGGNGSVIEINGDITSSGGSHALYIASGFDQVIIANCDIENTGSGYGIYCSSPLGLSYVNVSSDYGNAIEINNDLTISGGSVKSKNANAVYISSSTGSLTLEDTEITTESTSSSEYAIYSNATGAVELTRVKASSSSSSNCVYVSSASSLEIEGCDFSAASAYALNISGVSSTVILKDSIIENTGYSSTALSSSSALTISETLGKTMRIASTGEYSIALSYYANAGDELQITGGTITSGGTGVTVSYGEATISGGTISTTNTANTSNNRAVHFQGGTLTVSGGTIDGGSCDGIKVENSTSAVEITGGTIEGANGINADNITSLEVSDGEITGTTGSGIYSLKGNLDITGGTISTTSIAPNKAAVYFSSTGNLTVSEAEIDGGDVDGVYIANILSDLAITSGTFSGEMAINVVNAENVEISGGTFTGKSSGLYVSSSITPTVAIYGGTFNGTATTSYGINNANSSVTPTITPAGGETVTVKGKTAAVNGTFDYDITPFAALSYLYDTAPEYGIFPNPVLDLSYDPLYVMFYAEVPTFTITVNGGTANGETEPFPAEYDTEIEIKPTEDRVFIEWEVDGYPWLEIPTEPIIRISMPLNPVTFTAIYEEEVLPEENTRERDDPYDPVLQPIDVINYGESERRIRVYLEKFGYKSYITYVNRDFSVTPAITGAGGIDERTAINAIRSAVRRARTYNITEIKLNIPEGTFISVRMYFEIADLKEIYGVTITINYIKNEE
jgi:hypothetical protein